MLQDKTAIVLGASAKGGIGWETARCFAREGANVVVAARNLGKLQPLADDIGGLAIACDATQPESIENLVRETQKAYGPIHAGVYTPGQAWSKMIDDLSPEDLTGAMKLHYEGAVLFLQYVARAMTHGGAITLMSSILAQHYYPGTTAYATAKSALEQFGRFAAVEYGPKNIRVNCIRPTATRTPMVEQSLTIPGLYEASVKEIPLGRMGEAEDIAEAAAWLSSDRASFVTGVSLPVDGGNHLMRQPLMSELPSPEVLEAAYKKGQ
jgi:NAD(P)-dependent dehydrogenase (short-subunit alcohol dehydrogenase family)